MPHEFLAPGGKPSPEAQVEYLKSLNAFRMDENAGLKLELEALRLKTELMEKRTSKGLDAIDEMRSWFLTRRGVLTATFTDERATPVRLPFWPLFSLMILAGMTGAVLDYALHVAGVL